MIIYNVTVKIDTDTHDDWLQWMKKVHIPEVMNTGLFESHQIAKILGQDESDGLSYAIQYTCQDMRTLQRYSTQYAPALQKDHSERYKGKFVAFRTLMRIV